MARPRHPRRAQIQAMASEMWHHILAPGTTEFDAVRDLSLPQRRVLISMAMKALLKASDDLARLYEECNEASLTDIMESTRDAQAELGGRERVDDNFMGELLVDLVMDDKAPQRQRVLLAMLSPQLVIPTFDVRFEKGEITWEGEAPPPIVVNPR